ncbi:hypothetical protein [Chitinophaga rhizophila]|uniref:DUF1471 domain-containing protein n=1 Tax=Chitinophaga rhizophila TaxID=2866212 RepID=A0ABS7G6A2_9BACT|nr:hypothetical protein [Chitinophaga rhizophila]MBW8683179.1 hypothetical protein [Chitinophaga rhizophila]
MKINFKIALPILMVAPIALFAFKAPASNTASNSLLKGAEVSAAYSELHSSADAFVVKARATKSAESSVAEESIVTRSMPKVNDAYIQNILVKYE